MQAGDAVSFRINRVYTRSGDDGDTGLVGGRRTRKTDTRVEAYGDVDELNSWLGVVKEEAESGNPAVPPQPAAVSPQLPAVAPGGNALPERASLRSLIELLQQELFDLGSELATAQGDEWEGMWRAGQEHVDRLEALCDRYGDGLPELPSFILPGGSKLASALHVARTVARRAERRVVALGDELADAGAPPLNPCTVKYLNRLSDLLFILARWSLAIEGRDAPLWVKVKDRILP